MSLINSMLRDLEARRSDATAAAPFQEQVRAVPAGSASSMKFKLAAVAGGVVLLAVAAVAGLRLWPGPAPLAKATAPEAAGPAPIAGLTAAAMSREGMAAAIPAPAGDAPAARADEAKGASAGTVPAAAAGPAPAPAAVAAASATSAAPAIQTAGAGSPPAAAVAKRQAMPPAQAGNEDIPLQPVAAPAPATPAAEPLKIVREATPQPDAAMQLARQQLQDNALRDAIDTLQRALPQAGGRADYHAFLAALLQRDDQHRAAAEHYAAALRSAPDNGVWWMGLGISYQALQMAPQAQQAYRSAQASHGLSPELAAFVEARLAQLQRP